MAAGTGHGTVGCGASRSFRNSVRINPSYNFRRVARDDRVVRDIFSNHAAGTDDSRFAHCNPAKDRGVRADGGTLPDQRFNNLPICFGLKNAGCSGRPRVAVVYEHDPMADKSLILNGDSFADEGVALNLAVLADRNVLLDLDERANLGIVSDPTTVKVDKVAQINVLAERNSGCDLFHRSLFMV
jgi:hypothetical protein